MAKHTLRFDGMIAVAAGLCLSAALFPVAAYASGSSTNDSYNYAEGSTESELSAQSSYPSWFDLRHVGGTKVAAGDYTGGTSYVTSVKVQEPWGTCWAFGATAASEESILYEAGIPSTVNDLDLSELHLAWMGHTPLQAGSNQDGEGAILPSNFDEMTAAQKSAVVLDMAGAPILATSVYATGAGPVFEDAVPYKGAAGLKTATSDPSYWIWSADDDWSVDQTKRLTQDFPLEESSILPDAGGTVDATTGDVSLNVAGINAIKDELSSGKAVEIAYCAAIGDSLEAFTNVQTWASYAYPQKNKDGSFSSREPNHGVCIVGWDDDYPASNFLQGTTTDGISKSPAGNGAWIVKNSWGSSTEESPNHSLYGDEGYFYLSYYDSSICAEETFDYDISTITNQDSDEDYSLAEEYDFMASESEVTSVVADDTAAMANVFTAEERMTLKAVSSETTTPGSTVRYQVFLLGDDAADPTDGTQVADFSKSYTYGGYHRVSLPTPVTLENGQRYAVVETVSYGGTHQIFYKATKAEDCKGIVNEGESYACQNGQWVDYTQTIANHKKTVSDDLSYDNLPIKAFGNPLAEKPAITTESLADATAGTAYDVTLAATGTAPITWSVSAGALPDGLTLDGTTGQITGTPTTAGSYTFTVTATNGGGSASREYTVVVAAAAVSPEAPGDTDDTGTTQATSVTKSGTPRTADEGSPAVPMAAAAAVLLGFAVVLRRRCA